MNKFAYYSPMETVINKNANLAGIEVFSSFFKFYNSAVVVIDRTNTVRLPISTESLFPMPKFREFKNSFESICNARAVELLVRAERANLPLYIFYSGGIDSTLVLVSLLNVATVAQKKNITVLMSEESIIENPNFYHQHIKNNLKTNVSGIFQHLIGTPCIMVGGEHNDQLMGSDKMLDYIKIYGSEVLHRPYSRSIFFEQFSAKMGSEKHAEIWLDVLERLCAAAPVSIHTNADFLWWLNFSLKWQAVNMRMLVYVSPRNTHLITQEYLNFNYNHFYNTVEFQLWSMNNMDKKIKDTWKSYKWVCKDIIYDFTKDADYRDNKTKRGSLFNLIQQREAFNFVDKNNVFSKKQPPEAWYVSENDFVL